MTAERGTLVGISEGKLCYKVYYQSTKKIVHTREVAFIEEPDEELFIEEPRTVTLNKTISDTSNHPGKNRFAATVRPRKPKQTTPKIQKGNTEILPVIKTIGDQITETEQVAIREEEATEKDGNKVPKKKLGHPRGKNREKAGVKSDLNVAPIVIVTKKQIDEENSHRKTNRRRKRKEGHHY